MERKTSTNVCVIKTCLSTSVFGMCSLDILLTVVSFSLSLYITTPINCRYLVGFFFSSVDYNLVPECEEMIIWSLIFFFPVITRNTRKKLAQIELCYPFAICRSVCWNQWKPVCSVLPRCKALNVFFEIHKINKILNSGPSCINMKKLSYFAHPAIT